MVVMFSFVMDDSLFSQSSRVLSGRGNGRLTGEISDPDGNPIEGAQIDMLFQDGITRFEAFTNKKGKFRIMGLGRGQFNIVVRATGFVDQQVNRQISGINRNDPVIMTLQKSEKVILRADMQQEMDAAIALFNEKKYDDAIVKLQSIIDKFPDKPEMMQFHYKIGDCYREKGELDKALAKYEEVKKMAAENDQKSLQGQVLAEMAAVYEKKGDSAKSQEYLIASVEANPEDAELAFNVGAIYFNANKVDDAMKYFNIAIKAKPTYQKPYLQLSYCYLNKGDNANARKNLEKAVEIDPNSEDGQIAKSILDTLPN